MRPPATHSQTARGLDGLCFLPWNCLRPASYMGTPGGKGLGGKTPATVPTPAGPQSVPRTPGDTCRPPPRAGRDAGARVLRENPCRPLSPGPGSRPGVRAALLRAPSLPWAQLLPGGPLSPPVHRVFPACPPQTQPSVPSGSVSATCFRSAALSFPPLSVISRGRMRSFAGEPVGSVTFLP